jgi:hypothetical protein
MRTNEPLNLNEIPPTDLQTIANKLLPDTETLEINLDQYQDFPADGSCPHPEPDSS